MDLSDQFKWSYLILKLSSYLRSWAFSACLVLWFQNSYLWKCQLSVGWNIFGPYTYFSTLSNRFTSLVFPFMPTVETTRLVYFSSILLSFHCLIYWYLHYSLFIANFLLLFITRFSHKLLWQEISYNITDSQGP